MTKKVVLASLCHMTSGTFQGGYSAMFIASRRALQGQDRFCTIQEQPRENTGHHVSLLSTLSSLFLSHHCRASPVHCFHSSETPMECHALPGMHLADLHKSVKCELG